MSSLQSQKNDSLQQTRSSGRLIFAGTEVFAVEFVVYVGSHHPLDLSFDNLYNIGIPGVDEPFHDGVREHAEPTAGVAFGLARTLRAEIHKTRPAVLLSKVHLDCSGEKYVLDVGAQTAYEWH